MCFISTILLLLPSLLWAGTATVQWKPNSETDLQEYRVYSGTASRIYGPPVSVGLATSYTFNNLTGGVTYYFAVTAVDTSGNESGYSAEVSKYIPVSVDTQAPQVDISSPTSSGSYATTSPSIDLGGSASDNVGVTQVTWSASGGASGTAAGTTNWSVTGISLSAGQNTITVIAQDAAGNEGTATISVSYTPPLSVSSTNTSSTDTQAPEVAITSPTTDTSYTTSNSKVNLAGTASDNVGVTQVTWSSTGGGSGTASGTTSWSINGLRLASGANTITVTAEDAAGNQSKATITVTSTAQRSWWHWWRR